LISKLTLGSPTYLRLRARRTVCMYSPVHHVPCSTLITFEQKSSCCLLGCVCVARLWSTISSRAITVGASNTSPNIGTSSCMGEQVHSCVYSLNNFCFFFVVLQSSSSRLVSILPDLNSALLGGYLLFSPGASK
jgi:hypothetical protein